MAARTLPTFPAADVAAHNSEKSCYVTIGANVYDVTEFLEDHPGGKEYILEYAGKDVTKIMQDELSHSHSEAAYEILNDNRIGFVATKAIQNAAVDHDKPDEIVPLPPTAAGMAAMAGNEQAQSDVGGHEIFETTGLSAPADPTADTDPTIDFQRHKFLKLDQPLLMQVWRSGFSKEFYLKEVHRPRYYPKGKSAPLFGNMLEPLSLTPFWVVPAVWLPCVAFGTWRASEGLDPIALTLYWTVGLFLWTLVEYGLHRGLFHVDKYLPDNRVGITAHFLLHGIHHYLPMDKYRLVMPPTLFIVLATPFWKLAHTVFFYDWYAAVAVYCGGIFGYICYDETHYFLHHKTLPSYYRKLKSYHLAHHYEDSENGFGVTSRFWDTVFGTELGEKPKSKRTKVM